MTFWQQSYPAICSSLKLFPLIPSCFFPCLCHKREGLLCPECAVLVTTHWDTILSLTKCNKNFVSDKSCAFPLCNGLCFNRISQIYFWGLSINCKAKFIKKNVLPRKKNSMPGWSNSDGIEKYMYIGGYVFLTFNPYYRYALYLQINTYTSI